MDSEGSLTAAVLRFDAVYSEKKREKNLVDFSDLEHYALELFLRETPDGYERTDVAKLVAARFDEVMTDEYQDTNDAQDFLFRAVSKDNTNRFMVGDVKQSIYSFRQAMPDIFIAYKDTFEKYDRTRDEYPATITLDRNFRSRREVTESVNFVFTQLMSREAGGIDYTGDEKLAVGASYEEKPGCETVVEFIEDTDGDGADVLEPKRIAELIRDMLQSGFTVSDRDGERPATYKDFCILLRSANRHAPVYAENLRALGIPAWAAVSGGFFSFILVGESRFVISVGVACVNFHYVVDKSHCHSTGNVEILVGIFLQKIYHQSHVPRVLRIVFTPYVSRDVSLTIYAFFFIYFENELELLLKSVVIHDDLMQIES